MVNYHLLVPPPAQKHIVLNDLPRRLVVVGDVHGCLEELKDLLQACSYDGSLGDRVLLLGDLVNKGPLSAETIQYARSEGFLSVRGNHDDFALCHALKLVDAPRPPALDYLDRLSRDDLDWLQNLPYTITVPAWRTVCVHAGLVPDKCLSDQIATDMVTIRNVALQTDEQSGMEGTSRIDVGEPWVAHWQGHLVSTPESPGQADSDKWHVFFGHDARRGLQQHEFSTGLDTGCAYGKQLSAIILPDRELVQVNAKAAYSPVNE